MAAGQSTGRTLVTTRRRDAALTGTGGPGSSRAVHPRTRQRITWRPRWPPTGVRNPTTSSPPSPSDLGCLPLALSQAVAYLADQALGIADYRALLADRNPHAHRGCCPIRQAARRPARPVGAAWSLSVDLADRRTRRLRPALLALAAMLDPNGIPARS